MSYISAKEAAEKWGISKRMVYKYCTLNRIPDAFFEYGVWFIPEDAEKPSEQKKYVAPLPPLLKTLLKQRDGKQYRGLYNYVQINMVYSNGCMASNRLSRDQIEVLYKTDRIVTNKEPIKVNDIIEARNHFLAVDMILSNAMKPLTQSFVTQLQAQLISDNCRHKRHGAIATGIRKTNVGSKFGKTTPPKDISAALSKLFKEYESQKEIGFREILDLHVKFERIRPFEDCNGRVGRLLMFKECLRHNVTPFILDDKRRTGYLEGIRQWNVDRSILMDVCIDAQMRFEAQIELQGLLAFKPQ